MKVTLDEYRPVAYWKWRLGSTEASNDTTEGSESDEVCGICRIAYEGCCPECKRPGDDCPLIFGQCSHVFHMHCLLKWIGTESSNNARSIDGHGRRQSRNQSRQRVVPLDVHPMDGLEGETTAHDSRRLATTRYGSI